MNVELKDGSLIVSAEKTKNNDEKDEETSCRSVGPVHDFCTCCMRREGRRNPLLHPADGGAV